MTVDRAVDRATDGWELSTIVRMPRGMTDAEAYHFLSTDELPPFGLPESTLEDDDDDFDTSETGFSPGEATAFLAGRDVVASGVAFHGTHDQKTHGRRKKIKSSIAQPLFTVPSNQREEYEELVRLQAKRGTGHGASTITPDESDRFKDIFAKNGGDESPVVRKAVQDGDILASFEEYKAKKHPDVSAEKLKADIAVKTKKAFAGKKIGIRVTEESLLGVLEDERFKSQFETNTSHGWFAPDFRAGYEEQWFGIPKNADPKDRPIYGYVAVDGVTHVKMGDKLNQYGLFQVILKDDVRTRTTANFYDSLNILITQPSLIDEPSWQSGGFRGGSSGVEDFKKKDWSHLHYAEAQIHGGVKLDDIEEVLLPTPPSDELKALLEKRGVKWRLGYKPPQTSEVSA